MPQTPNRREATEGPFRRSLRLAHLLSVDFEIKRDPGPLWNSNDTLRLQLPQKALGGSPSLETAFPMFSGVLSQSSHLTQLRVSLGLGSHLCTPTQLQIGTLNPGCRKENAELWLPHFLTFTSCSACLGENLVPSSASLPLTPLPVRALSPTPTVEGEVAPHGHQAVSVLPALRWSWELSPRVHCQPVPDYLVSTLDMPCGEHCAADFAILCPAPGLSCFCQHLGRAWEILQGSSGLSVSTGQPGCSSASGQDHRSCCVLQGGVNWGTGGLILG